MNKLFGKKSSRADYYDGSNDLTGQEASEGLSEHQTSAESSESAMYSGNHPPVGRKTPFLAGLAKKVVKGREERRSGAAARVGGVAHPERAVEKALSSSLFDYGYILQVADVARKDASYARKAAGALGNHFKPFGASAAVGRAFKVLLVLVLNAGEVFRNTMTSPDSLSKIRNTLTSDRTEVSVKRTGAKVMSALAYDEQNPSGSFTQVYNDIKGPEEPAGGTPVDINDILFGDQQQTGSQTFPTPGEQLKDIERRTKQIQGIVSVFQETVAHAKADELSTSPLIQEFYPKCVKGQDYIDSHVEWVTVQADLEEQERQKTSVPTNPNPFADAVPDSNPFAPELRNATATATAPVEKTPAQNVLDLMLSTHSSLTEAFKLYDLRLGLAREHQQLEAVQERSKQDVRSDPRSPPTEPSESQSASAPLVSFDDATSIPASHSFSSNNPFTGPASNNPFATLADDTLSERAQGKRPQ